VKIRRHLTYANVTATVALLLTVGGGAAYAVDRINSRDVVNGSIRSVDLKNHRAVRGIDVRKNSLTAHQIDERTLNLSSVARIGGAEAVNCDPNSPSVLTICARTQLDLDRRSRVLVIVTGNQESLGGPAQAGCRVTVDGTRESLGVLPGEAAHDNTSAGATNGFARTFVPPRTLSPGLHQFALACQQFSGNARIDTPTIAAVAIGTE
jgi:hypothetical protein